MERHLQLTTCTVDLETGVVQEPHGHRVQLSPLLLGVLATLVRTPSQSISREDLGGEGRVVDRAVARLRRALEADPKRPVHLLTVHGEGYRFEPLAVTTLQEHDQADWLTLGPATIELGSGVVHGPRGERALTPGESAVLMKLRKTSEVVDRPALARAALGTTGSGRRVDTLVARLRSKVERDPAAPDYLITRRGHGYRLRAPKPPDPHLAVVVASELDQVPWELVAQHEVFVAAVSPRLEVAVADPERALAWATAIRHVAQRSALVRGAFATVRGGDGRLRYAGVLLDELDALCARCPPGAVAVSPSVWEVVAPRPHHRAPTGEALLFAPTSRPAPAPVPAGIEVSEAAAEAAAVLAVFRAPFSARAAEYLLERTDADALIDELVLAGSLRVAYVATGVCFEPPDGLPPPAARVRHVAWCVEGEASEADFVAAVAVASAPIRASLLAAWCTASTSPSEALLAALSSSADAELDLHAASVYARAGLDERAAAAWKRAAGLPTLRPAALRGLGRWHLENHRVPLAVAALREAAVHLPEAELDLAEALDASGLPAEADAAYDRVRTRRRLGGDRAGEVEVLLRRAARLDGRGDGDAARELRALARALR
jgi:DNA-binding response OmpR family regulator/tetratricopeptide (TPR) repeat protein